MRIKGVDPEHAPEAVKAVFARSLQLFGRVLTPNLAMAHRPEILLNVSQLGMAIGAGGVLEARLKLMVSVRAAQMIGCPF